MGTGNRFGTESSCTRLASFRGLESLETRLFLSVSPAGEFVDPVRVLDGKLQTVDVSLDGNEGRAVRGSWIVTFEQNDDNSFKQMSHDGLREVTFFKSQTTQAKESASKAVAGIGTEFRFDSYLGNLGSAEILAPVDADPKEVVARLMKLPGVISVTPNWIYGNSMGIPNDLSFTSPTFPRQWPLLNPSNPSNDIDAVTAWDKATGSDAVVVGVIDSGTMTGHPDLAGNIYSNPNEIANNGIDDDGNGFVDDNRGWNFIAGSKDVQDDNGHGTHVAGIIGAVGNNNVGITGVAWDVSILTLKAADAAGKVPDAAVLAAINYANALKLSGTNLRVLNNSYGGLIGNTNIYNAIKTTADRDIVFVASAGNSQYDNDLLPAYPASYDLPNIISVAATDSQDALAGFSHFGLTSVDLAAPGVAIRSTVRYTTASAPKYGDFTGTSQAAPHVSGVAALAFSLAPTAKHTDVKDAILSSTDALSSLAGKTVTGGRLNSARALEAILPNNSPALLGHFGDQSDETILIRLNPSNPSLVDVVVNSVLFSTNPIANYAAIYVNAGNGNNTVTIDAGITLRTTLIGGSGSDTIYGGSGPDSIVGGGGNDSLYGNVGNDSLGGGEGNDNLFGGNGNDVITGGDGNDTQTGGGGNDSFNFANTNAFQTDYVSETGTVVDGDVLDFSGVTTDVTVNLSSADSLLGSHANRDVRLLNSSTLKSNIENVTGGTGDDTITGSAVGNVLLGGPGFDSILGMAGHDTLNGQSNGDYLGGGNGNDEIQGDLGHDNIIGGVGDDTLFGGNGNDTIDGGDGNDLLQGVAGNDSLIGGTGNDWLIGDIGNDILRGADAPGFIDTLDGNSGTDQADRDSGWDILTSIEQIL